VRHNCKAQFQVNIQLHIAITFLALRYTEFRSRTPTSTCHPADESMPAMWLVSKTKQSCKLQSCTHRVNLNPKILLLSLTPPKSTGFCLFTRIITPTPPHPTHRSNTQHTPKVDGEQWRPRISHGKPDFLTAQNLHHHHTLHSHPLAHSPWAHNRAGTGRDADLAPPPLVSPSPAACSQCTTTSLGRIKSLRFAQATSSSAPRSCPMTGDIPSLPVVDTNVTHYVTCSITNPCNRHGTLCLVLWGAPMSRMP
jgi:hypothetical protein